MSFSVGAQPALSEWWVISCQSSYRNYTWCLSSLSLFLFRLTACATSKSYLILSAYWLTFQQKSSGLFADGLCLPDDVCLYSMNSVYQDVCKRKKRERFFCASCQRQIVRKDLFSISREKAHLRYDLSKPQSIKDQVNQGSPFFRRRSLHLKIFLCPRFNSWHPVPPPPRFTFQGCSSQEAPRLDKRLVERTREGGRGSFQRWINTTHSR